MKWISEETLKDCQIFRYSKMENGKEGVIPVKVEDLPELRSEVIGEALMVTRQFFLSFREGRARTMCKFCESLEIWHNIHEFDNDHAPKDEKRKHEYRVALLIHSWCPKYKTKRQASRTTDYRNKGLGYKLNYCPECGRKLKV